MVVVQFIVKLINSPHQLKAGFYSKELRELLLLLMLGDVNFIETDDILINPL